MSSGSGSGSDNSGDIGSEGSLGEEAKTPIIMPSITSKGGEKMSLKDILKHQINIQKVTSTSSASEASPAKTDLNNAYMSMFDLKPVPTEIKKEEKK